MGGIGRYRADRLAIGLSVDRSIGISGQPRGISAVLHHLIEYIAETGSTNADLAKRLQSAALVREGDWLVADRQMAGRGRQGREWFDGSGNFMGSTVVHPVPTDPPISSLALAAGLALFEMCQPLCPDSASLILKWPNDLLLNDAKLSGVLLERSAGAVIVGIGVNLAKAPDLADRATAAFSDHGPAPDRDYFAESLQLQFSVELERWRTYGIEPLLRRWMVVGHPVGTALSVHDSSAAVQTGTFGGLADDGSLLLRLADGSTRAIHAGDVLLD